MPKTITQINQMKQERAAVFKQACDLNDKVTAEKRDFNADEQKKYDDFLVDLEARKKVIAREEQLSGVGTELDTTTRSVIRPEIHTPETDSDVDAEQRTAAQRIMDRRGSKEYHRTFRTYVREGRHGIPIAEYRALQTDSDVDGGYLVLPTQMAQGILKNLDDEVHIRQKARKFTLVGAKSLGVIKRTAKLSTWAWGSELSAPTPDTALKFGKRELTPHYATGEAIISRDLMMNAVESVESMVNTEIGRDGGELQERAFISGTGAGQPLGVFTASNDGISTSRDISTDNTATAITVDGLINAKFALKPQYRRTAEWMFHRDSIKMLSKLKDGEGRYLWEPSVKVGTPDQLLALPFVENEWVPNTFTTGQYVGILANWQYYWIADGLDIQVQRLIELYARTNQDGFVARLKTDGAPQLEEAFVRVKLG